MRSFRLVLFVWALVSASLLAAEELDRLKEMLGEETIAEGWIYEDIEAGYEEARTTGKPLLVAFSCVP